MYFYFYIIEIFFGVIFENYLSLEYILLGCVYVYFLFILDI